MQLEPASARDEAVRARGAAQPEARPHTARAPRVWGADRLLVAYGIEARAARAARVACGAMFCVRCFATLSSRCLRVQARPVRHSARTAR